VTPKVPPLLKVFWTIFGTAALATLALGACATAPEPAFPYQGGFGSEQTFTGELRLGFERQSFNECYLEFRGSAMADLGRLAPSPALNDQRAPYATQVTLVGRRRSLINMGQEGPSGQGFGHLGMYPCLIEASRITAARRP
jgi:hypothetical protein